LLALPHVRYDEWLARLKAADTGEVEMQMRIPALTLLDFFERNLAADSGVILDTERASHASRSLREATVLGHGEMERWVSYWQKVGFLDG